MKVLGKHFLCPGSRFWRRNKPCDVSQSRKGYPQYPNPQRHCQRCHKEHCKSYKRHTKQLPTQTQQKNSPKMSLQVSMDKNQMTPSALCGCRCDHLALLGPWGWDKLQVDEPSPGQVQPGSGKELFPTELSLALFFQGHSNSMEVGLKPSAA